MNLRDKVTAKLAKNKQLSQLNAKQALRRLYGSVYDKNRVLYFTKGYSRDSYINENIGAYND